MCSLCWKIHYFFWDLKAPSWHQLHRQHFILFQQLRTFKYQITIKWKRGILHSLLKRWNCMPRRPIALQKVYEAELFFFGHSFKICSKRHIPQSCFTPYIWLHQAVVVWHAYLVSSIQSLKRHSLPAAGHWRGRPLSEAGTAFACEACWRQAPQTDDSSTPAVCAVQPGSAEVRLKRWRWQIAQRADCAENYTWHGRQETAQVQAAYWNDKWKGNVCT